MTLEKFSASAALRFGEYEITLGMHPMLAVIPGKHLKKQGEIEITVANTAVNEIHAKKHIIQSFPKAEIGAYQDKLEKFEKRKAPLRFGTVKIEKIRTENPK